MRVYIYYIVLYDVYLSEYLNFDTFFDVDNKLTESFDCQMIHVINIMRLLYFYNFHLTTTIRIQSIKEFIILFYARSINAFSFNNSTMIVIFT